jgi:hypothetical protein
MIDSLRHSWYLSVLVEFSTDVELVKLIVCKHKTLLSKSGFCNSHANHSAPLVILT